MTAIEALSRAMHEVNERFALPPFDRNVRAMQSQVRSLEAWLGEIGETKPTFDRVRQALQRFHERQVTEHVKDARLVCFARSRWERKSTG